MTKPDRPTITPALVARFRDYWLRPGDGGDWGSLHIVLADGNIQDHHVDFCEMWALERGDTEGAKLAAILRTMSKSQRGRIERFATMPVLTTREAFVGWGLRPRSFAVTVSGPPWVDRYPTRLTGHEVWHDGTRRRVVSVDRMFRLPAHTDTPVFEVTLAGGSDPDRPWMRLQWQ